jgi:hypothetical protein
MNSLVRRPPVALCGLTGAQKSQDGVWEIELHYALDTQRAVL